MNLDLSSDCNVHGSSILREIEYFLKNETQDDFGHQHFYDDLYKEDIENFSLGFISKEDIQIDDIYHIEIQENYVVISFVYVSMMVCEEDVERFLTEKLTKIRLHLFTNMHCNCLDLLAEKELGIWKNRSRLGQRAGAGWDTFDDAKLMIFSHTVTFQLKSYC